mgnify:CR=1 FL=1
MICEKNRAIDKMKSMIEHCSIPHKFWMTYDFTRADEEQRTRFLHYYLWNGLANRLRSKIKVYAVGMGWPHQRKHFHAIITSNKPIPEKINLGHIEPPTVMVIDAMLEQMIGAGRWNGDQFIADVWGEKSVIVGENNRFWRRVAFGGYDRHRFHLQPYNGELGGVGYIFHHHDKVIWPDNEGVEEFSHPKYRRKRPKRGKKRA